MFFNIVNVGLRNDCDFPRLGLLGGEISDSLLYLKHLNYLDLSCNDFGGIPTPNFLGSFGRLRRLNLYGAEFGGMIPPQLGNLSRLRYLNLGEYQMSISNLNWLSGISSLKYLDLGNVDLSTNWMQAVNMLPSLLELHMSSCELNGFPHYSNPTFVTMISILLYLVGCLTSVPTLGVFT